MLLYLEKNLPVLSVLEKKNLHRKRGCSVFIQYRNSRLQMRAKRIEAGTSLSFEALEGTEVENLSSVLESNDLVFFTHTLCPYAERTWITLLEKVSFVHAELIVLN